MKTFNDLKDGDTIYLLEGSHLTKCKFHSVVKECPNSIVFQLPHLDRNSIFYSMDVNVPYFNAYGDTYCIASIEGLIKFIYDKCW